MCVYLQYFNGVFYKVFGTQEQALCPGVLWHILSDSFPTGIENSQSLSRKAECRTETSVPNYGRFCEYFILLGLLDYCWCKPFAHFYLFTLFTNMRLYLVDKKEQLTKHEQKGREERRKGGREGEREGGKKGKLQTSRNIPLKKKKKTLKLSSQYIIGINKNL